MNKISKRDQWVAVSMDGFGQLMASRPKVAVVHDLIQNAVDEDVNSVTVVLESIPGRRGRARLMVEDDSPEGFADLTDAYTMYKPSKKKDDPTKRGRFNEGEKFVLSQCDEATITTTTGTVIFNDDGRTVTKATRPCGSLFDGVVRWTQDDVEEVLTAVQHLLVPDGITVTINGSIMDGRLPVTVLEGVSLSTLRVAEDGSFKPTKRQTTVEIVVPQNGEKPHIYEMGIPVVEIDTPWHINVGQKVPLNRDRDNVTPAYRRALLAVVLDATVDLLDAEETSNVWVTEAMPEASAETLKTVADTRWGKGWVVHTPTDPEANANAASHGVSVVHGASLPGSVWTALRDNDLTSSSASEYSLGPKSGKDFPDAPRTPLTDEIQRYVGSVAGQLLGFRHTVKVIDDPDYGCQGQYSHGHITIGLQQMPAAKDAASFAASVDSLIIHECAHRYESNHLSTAYYEACCRLGAKIRTIEDRWTMDTAEYLR